MSIVIIPAYQPDEALVKIADRLWADGYRVIVVDDGSGEAYQPVFERIQDICIVLRHPCNRGKGAAIRTALSYVKKEVWNSGPIGIMDADGQHLPEDMAHLLKTAKTHRTALTIGVRTVGKEMPLRSRLGNRITRADFALVSGVRVSDTQTGLRAFWPELIPRLLAVKGERYEYEMNVLMELARAGVPIVEVPIHTLYRDQENSSSHFRVFWNSLRVYKEIFLFTLSSLSSFVLDYLLFALLMLLLPHTAAGTLFANVSARIVSAAYNYGMNCRLVFHTEGRASTAVRYFALAVWILMMNSLLLELFVQLLHMSVYPAKLLTESLLFLMSWLVQSGIIFRKNKYAEKEKPSCKRQEDTV